VGSHKVNGVSALHSRLLVQTIFADFASLFPERFTNVTNGVTPRRWLVQANPGLASLIDATLGEGWRADLDRLSQLRAQADDADFRTAFGRVKQANKERLAAHIASTLGLKLDPASLFDVQVKRFHEYKRQLLNVLHVVTRYQAILREPQADWQPRTVIFAGKAGVVVPDGQADHPPHPRRGGGGEPGPAGGQPAEGGVHAELRRVDGRADHAGAPSCRSRSPPPAPRPRAPAT
jgi:glucan phosphorylase